MLRVEVSEEGHEALPAIDVDEASFVIGSDPAARVRLPAGEARPAHVRIDGVSWRTADASGSIGEGVTFEIGGYRVRVGPAPAGTVATPPQRTESLARELVRALLGAGGAPTLEVERGPVIGAKRALAPPESVLVIGRGDDASWILDDVDLSKRHVEIRRGWDGVRVIDLGSKNGTRVDGVKVEVGGVELHNGAEIVIGKVVMRYRDPAEGHIGASDVPRRGTKAAPPLTRSNPTVFWIAIAIGVAAIAGLIWIAAG